MKVEIHTKENCLNFKISTLVSFKKLHDFISHFAGCGWKPLETTLVPLVLMRSLNISFALGIYSKAWEARNNSGVGLSHELRRSEV